MERPASPKSPPEPSEAASSPPSSPVPSDSVAAPADGERKKPTRNKKRKPKPSSDEVADEQAAPAPSRSKPKKGSKKRKEGKDGEEGATRKKPRKPARRPAPAAAGQVEQFSAAQLAVNEQMRRALEEDQYSALGSIVDTDSDDDDNQYRVRGGTMRIDRNTMLAAMRKRIWLERNGGAAALVAPEDGGDASARRGGRKKKKRKKSKRSKDELASPTVTTKDASDNEVDRMGGMGGSEDMSFDDPMPIERDEASIFGQTTGASNATWVECDKCKKWRRLRGVVDEKKLPSKWYCSMNKNDPERSRCSAPEEEYETQNTPESAADARTRKHLRVWVRRLQANEAYESRQPTMTRGKKRSAAASSKEPYEWVRCCNPSCGKWRAILRCMDAKTHVMDRAAHGEWYCVMNTWDEKIASCAAPQENLPAIGCPPWVMQDEN